MAFCQNCGAKLQTGARFCIECGVAVGSTGNAKVFNEREISFDGEIRKCPHCGATLNSFTGICPECGNELRGTKIDKSIKQFFKKIEEYSDGYETTQDRDKAENHYTPRIFCALGALIFLVMGFMNDGSTSDETVYACRIAGFCFLTFTIMFPQFMTQEDKKKRNLIETFIVPNNKESILEFLILSASQIQPGANPFTKEGKRTALWNKIWKTKIRQTITKSKLVFMNDTLAQQQIRMIKKEYRIR